MRHQPWNGSLWVLLELVGSVCMRKGSTNFGKSSWKPTSKCICPCRSRKGRQVQWRLPNGIGQIAAEDNAREGTPFEEGDDASGQVHTPGPQWEAQQQQQQLQQRRLSNGLASIADAVEQASPFVPRPKPPGSPPSSPPAAQVCQHLCRFYQYAVWTSLLTAEQALRCLSRLAQVPLAWNYTWEFMKSLRPRDAQGHMHDSSAAAEEGNGGSPSPQAAVLEEYRQKQLKKMRDAAAKAGVTLDAGWTVEARMRQNGETKGARTRLLCLPGA